MCRAVVLSWQACKIAQMLLLGETDSTTASSDGNDRDSPVMPAMTADQRAARLVYIIRKLRVRQRFVLGSWLVRSALARPRTWWQSRPADVASVFRAVEMCQHWETTVAFVVQSLPLVSESQVCARGDMCVALRAWPQRVATCTQIVDTWLPMADRSIPMCVSGGRLRSLVEMLVACGRRASSVQRGAMEVVLFRIQQCFGKVRAPPFVVPLCAVSAAQGAHMKRCGVVGAASASTCVASRGVDQASYASCPPFLLSLSPTCRHSSLPCAVQLLSSPAASTW